MSKTARDYSETLFLPKTDFPMRAGLPQKEPEILAHWQRIDLYGRLRAASNGRTKFVLHDGPPYANGNIHMGTALGSMLKDVVTRSQQMMGFEANYVPGWDCHGLPIEWKVEEEYRAKGRDKDTVPIIEFRRECRAFAQHWVDVQREEFMRLGGIGDWDHYYSTMTNPAEAQIAREIMKFAANGTLYRGSKPVMWSVVEQTALAEAEVEYEDYTSDTVWVKFPIVDIRLNFDPQATPRDIASKQQLRSDLLQSFVIIWTTTPWTIPANRAISFSFDIEYGLYEVVEAPPNNWAKVGDRYLIAANLADEVSERSKAKLTRLHDVVFDDGPAKLTMTCAHPLRHLDMTSQSRYLPETMLLILTVRGSYILRPVTAVTTSKSGQRTRASSKNVASTPLSLPPSTKISLSLTRLLDSLASESLRTRVERATQTRPSSKPLLTLTC